jgi:DNA-directed RNA polymerase specialized sigma24 family protein
MRSKPGASLSEIEAVYRERFPEFRRVAAAIVGDREAALDVVQDAFGKAIRRRRTFRGETASAESAKLVGYDATGRVTLIRLIPPTP